MALQQEIAAALGTTAVYFCDPALALAAADQRAHQRPAAGLRDPCRGTQDEATMSGMCRHISEAVQPRLRHCFVMPTFPLKTREPTPGKSAVVAVSETLLQMTTTSVSRTVIRRSSPVTCSMRRPRLVAVE